MHTATDPDVIAKGVHSGSVILDDVELVRSPPHRPYKPLIRPTEAAVKFAGAKLLRCVGSSRGHRGVGPCEANRCRGSTTLTPHLIPNSSPTRTLTPKKSQHAPYEEKKNHSTFHCKRPLFCVLDSMGRSAGATPFQSLNPDRWLIAGPRPKAE